MVTGCNLAKITATAVVLCALSVNATGAEATPPESGPFAADNFSATLWLTTNYMFRGISNSDGPAVQGSFDWGYEGFFLGVWASNTEFSDSTVEIDYYGGYRWTWSGLDFTLQGIYYSYPGEGENTSDGLDPGIGVEADYAEINLGASHTFDGPWAPGIGVNYFYSPDAFGEDGDNHTLQGSFGLALPGEVGFYANVGYTDFEGDQSSGAIGGYDYVYFSVGINRDFRGFKFDLGYVGTDESPDLETFYADAPLPNGDNFRDLIEGEVVFTVSRSF